MSNDSKPAADRGSECNDLLGPVAEALQRAYYYTELGGWRGPEVEDGERWEAVAVKAVRMVETERERCASLCRRVADETRNSEVARIAGQMLANWISTGNPMADAEMARRDALGPWEDGA